MITKENNGMSKRDSRLTADITEEAHDLLRGLVSKHEHGKGYFVEKMIRKFCVVEPSEDKPKAARSKQKSYPSNLDEQFELLWDTKGKVGAKNGPKGAYNKFKKLAEGASEEGCETFTKMLMDDILNHKHEPGYPEMHLTTYLNNQRWVR